MRKNMLWAGGCILAMLLAAIAFRLWRNEPIRPQEQYIAPGAMVYRTTHYGICGHKNTNTSLAGPEVIGLPIGNVDKAFAPWQVDEAAAMRIELSRRVDQLCDKHYVLVISGDHLAIFHNATGGEDLLEIRTIAIAPERLPDQVREELSAGRVYSSLREIEKAIEDYTS